MPFRVGGDEYLLASEAGELIVTEDGEFYIAFQIYIKLTIPIPED